jgi:hypothetical protein
MNRRQFLSSAILACGAVQIAGQVEGAELPRPTLPTVRWGKHQLSRLLVGHNPIKGVSHFSSQLSTEMKQWFSDDTARVVQLLRRCEEAGINTCQMGFRPSERPLIEEPLRQFYGGGGAMQWIASFYSSPADPAAAREELARIMEMNPRPIGVQQVGNTTDALMKQGKADLSQENLKRFRDAGLLVGLGSHNHEAIDYAADKGWDADFYQCSFYRSVFGPNPPRPGEIFDDADRAAMVKTIRQLPKPCLAFKVLAGNRHCASPLALEQALRFAFDNIKSTDVVLVGMWQKHKDQVGENVSTVRSLTAHGPPTAGNAQRGL